MIDLLYHTILDYTTKSGVNYSEIKISYQLFGKELHTAPVVLVNHALTGNSNVSDSQTGWWKPIVGKGKVIDTNRFTVIAFNIPGNGYDGYFIENYNHFNADDIAYLFIKSLDHLKIDSLYAAIGGSLGGGLVWHMAVQRPQLIKNLISVGADWKATDWIIGISHVQNSILNNSKEPLKDARKMAMLFYRTEASLKSKFNRTKTDDLSLFNIESWLDHHGNKLKRRFNLSSYKLMNHLLSTIDITEGNNRSFQEVIAPVQSIITQIAIDTDIFFVKDEAIATKNMLDEIGKENSYHEIKSIHGHDAFLIEFEQIESFLKPIFK